MKFAPQLDNFIAVRPAPNVGIKVISINISLTTTIQFS